MKDSTKQAQKKLFYNCLKKRPMTTAMAADDTGIMRCNLTRFVAEFEKHGQITVVKKAKCEYTGHPAKYYSTDPKYFPTDTEPELFPTKSRAYHI